MLALRLQGLRITEKAKCSSEGFDWRAGREGEGTCLGGVQVAAHESVAGDDVTH